MSEAQKLSLKESILIRETINQMDADNELNKKYGQHGDGLCDSGPCAPDIRYRGTRLHHALCHCGLTSWPVEHHCPIICGCLDTGRFQPNLRAVSIYKSLRCLVSNPPGEATFPICVNTAIELDFASPCLHLYNCAVCERVSEIR